MKVLITPRSFAKNDPAPLELLRGKGLEIVRNDTGGILTASRMALLAADCDGIIVGVDPLDRDAIHGAPHLRAVAKYGVGVDNIDLDACASRDIAVSRTVGANSAAVADFAFALMLALARKVVPIDRGCRAGDWRKITTADVAGKRLGHLGLGAIGRQMVSRAKGFAMEVSAFDPYWDEEYTRANAVARLEVDDICRDCDFISLHLPLSEQTRNILDERRLRLMKPGTFVINTARGGLIDEVALLRALLAGRIAGAGLDAFSEEPPRETGWFGLNNVILGSHCAASTEGAADAMSRQAAENLLRDLGL